MTPPPFAMSKEVCMPPSPFLSPSVFFFCLFYWKHPEWREMSHVALFRRLLFLSIWNSLLAPLAVYSIRCFEPVCSIVSLHFPLFLQTSVSLLNQHPTHHHPTPPPIHECAHRHSARFPAPVLWASLVSLLCSLKDLGGGEGLVMVAHTARHLGLFLLWPTAFLLDQKLK